METEAGSVSGWSLKQLGEKIRGKHYRNDGSQVSVEDQYWPAAAVNPEVILRSLLAQRPMLVDWNGHVYVLYGAVFDEYVYSSGALSHSIRQLLLVDTRFSDERREVVFDRLHDDWGKVGGALELTVSR